MDADFRSRLQELADDPDWVMLREPDNWTQPVEVRTILRWPLTPIHGKRVQPRGWADVKVSVPFREIRVYRSYTDGSNWERVQLLSTMGGGVLEIYVQAVGTGSMDNLCREYVEDVAFLFPFNHRVQESVMALTAERKDRRQFSNGESQRATAEATSTPSSS